MNGADPYNAGPAYFFFNLGCPKNLVDAERVAARLEEAGWRPAAAPERASLLVVTTCAFISAAEEESIGEILRVASLKRPDQRLAVLGCLVTREGDRLSDLLPEVDIFLPVDEMCRLAETIGAGISESAVGVAAGRVLFTPPHIAYLKIADGCSNRCSYCTIPAIRGGLACAAPEVLTAEAASLAERGVRELVLVAQDTAAYRSGRGIGRSLYDLVDSISAAVDAPWIRLMYLHPAHIDIERLIRLIDEEKVLRYVDIPIQHASDGVLRGMDRRYGRGDIERLFDVLRTRVDRLVMRTTVMVGFPGETEADVAGLVDFLETFEFDHVGVFAYSPERGTAAARLKSAVAEEEVERRRSEILDIQMDISHRRLEARIGRTETILVDEHLPAAESPRPGVWGAGRFYGQAYEIDGLTFLEGAPVPAGSFTRGRISSAGAYDLFARSP
jgi:ribosomal protein S12 methylthiotransferase